MRMDQHIKQLIEKYTFEAARLSHYEALERYNMAYAQAKELGNAFTIRACAANLGAMYVSLGKKDEAEKGLKYLKEATPPEGMADGVSNGDLFFNFGLAYTVLGRFREAGSSFQQALQEYRKERDNLNMEIETLKQLIQVSEDRRKYGEKVDWCRELEETYKRANRLKEQLQVMIQRITLQLPGQRDKLQQQQDQLEQDETQQDSEVEQDTDRELERCCDLFNSIRQHEVKGQDMAEVGMLVQMSVLLTKVRRLKEARKYLEEALSLFEAEDGQSLEWAVVLQNLGAVCNFLHDWKTALPYHKQAAAIYQYYANLPPDPKSPIMPQAAQRCLVHCLANHGYALVHLEDVDEARVIFQKAQDQAEYSGDPNIKWQLAEVLGAIHFQIAFHDLDFHRRLNKEARFQLPASRLEHLKKSMMQYKMALTCVASAPGDTEDVCNRVLEKCIRVETMIQKVSQGLPAAFFRCDFHPTQADNATDNSAGESCKSDEKKEVDGGTRGRQGEDNRETGKKTDEECHPSCSKEDSKGMEKMMRTPPAAEDVEKTMRTPPAAEDDEKTMRTPPAAEDDEKTMRTPPAAEDDDDETQVKAEYRKQLGTDTLQGAGEKQTVHADVHAQQHTQHHSSSAESSSSDTDEDDEDSSSTDEEEWEQRQLPPVPSQSPPRTLEASGTYETPQQNEEMIINQLYGSSKSRPRSPTNGELSVHFDTKNQPRSGELASLSKRRTSLNYFISSDEEHEEATKQRKPAAPGAGHSDSDDESLGTGQDSTEEPSTSDSSKQDPKQVEVPHGQNKGDNKDSKTCSIM